MIRPVTVEPDLSNPKKKTNFFTLLIVSSDQFSHLFLVPRNLYRDIMFDDEFAVKKFAGSQLHGTT